MFDERSLMRMAQDWSEESGHLGALTAVLYGIALGCQARTIVETGVWRGGSTRALLLAAARTGGRVYSIDADDCSGVVPEELRLWWTFLRGRTQDIGRAWAMPIDLLMVDAEHTYEGAGGDLRLFGAHVRPGGLILMDDCWETWPGVLRAFHEFPESRCAAKQLIPYGVPGAWDGERRTLGFIRLKGGG